ncbi:MAG TPA: DUF721 domain-containing protein [Synechococcales cyanobacterium M55_K2018_004]|nr:DUF721 domain-containing protein [Synechococcales cyanobacterium M55_K2018_004]
MPFDSLHQLLGTLHQQREWRSHQEFQQLLRCWSAIVGQVVAQQTRPVAIRRGVLQVATANSVWAQNLMFERRRILEKLHTQVNFSEAVTDIHFSTAYWKHGAATPPPEADSLRDWHNHPSRVPYAGEGRSPRTPPPSDAQTAFKQWSATVKARSQHLPLCPQCRCPTPPGELERWSACSLCAAKQWATRPHPPSCQAENPEHR